MQFAVLLLALAGAVLAHDGAHDNTLTLTESTTVTVFKCTGAPATVCSQSTMTVALPPPGMPYVTGTETPAVPFVTPPPMSSGSTSVFMIETPAIPSASSSSVNVEVPPTDVASTPVTPTEVVPTSAVPTQTPTYTPTNGTVSGNNTTTLTASQSVSSITTVTSTVSTASSGATSSSTPPPQAGNGVAVVPSVMLGLLALGASIFA